LKKLNSAGGGAVVSPIHKSTSYQELTEYMKMNAIPRIQPNQRLASSKVLRVFKEEGKRYCMLVAYPQSGKSGTFQSVIRNLLVNDYVKRAIILTGSAETELRNQLVEDTKKYNGSFYETGAIHILMRQDLEAKLPALRLATRFPRTRSSSRRSWSLPWTTL
jgi:hypothetical protein